MKRLLCKDLIANSFDKLSAVLFSSLEKASLSNGNSAYRGTLLVWNKNKAARLAISTFSAIKFRRPDSFVNRRPDCGMRFVFADRKQSVATETVKFDDE